MVALHIFLFVPTADAVFEGMIQPAIIAELRRYSRICRTSGSSSNFSDPAPDIRDPGQDDIGREIACLPDFQNVGDLISWFAEFPWVQFRETITTYSSTSEM